MQDSRGHPLLNPPTQTPFFFFLPLMSLLVSSPSYPFFSVSLGLKKRTRKAFGIRKKEKDNDST